MIIVEIIIIAKNIEGPVMQLKLRDRKVFIIF
jgi:hypothetical protein